MKSESGAADGCINGAASAQLSTSFLSGDSQQKQQEQLATAPTVAPPPCSRRQKAAVAVTVVARCGVQRRHGVMRWCGKAEALSHTRSSPPRTPPSWPSPRHRRDHCSGKDCLGGPAHLRKPVQCARAHLPPSPQSSLSLSLPPPPLSLSLNLQYRAPPKR